MSKKVEKMICQNCHTEMTPGTKTRSKVMEWTEYICPNCGSVWSDGKPLPGHEPVYPVIIETETDAEVYADELLTKAVRPEEMDAEIEARAGYIENVVLAEPEPKLEAKPEPKPAPKPRSKRKRRAKVAKVEVGDEGVVGDEVVEREGENE